MDIYRRDPNVLYARIEHATESGVYRTDDGGANWRKLSDVNPRPMYFSQIRIDPQTDSRIYVLGVQLHVSDDGGKTFRDDGAERIHVDHHAMWINPAEPESPASSATTAASASPTTVRPRGCGCPTCCWRRPITSSSTCSRRITSAPGCRTTTPGADRAPCAPTAASTTTTGTWSSGGDGFQPLMDPNDSHIVYARVAGRPHEPHRPPHQRAHGRAPRAARAEAVRAIHAPTASTGTRRCSSRRSTPRPSTSARTWC